MPKVTIGDPTSDHVTLEALRREYPHGTNDWDTNWVTVRVEVVASPWRGHFQTGVLTWEFEKLLADLRTLYESLQGDVVFVPTEGELRLVFVPDATGHIKIRGESSPAGVGPRLSFELPEIDQSFLPAIMDQLTVLVEVFPVTKLQR